MKYDTDQRQEYLDFASRITGVKDFGHCRTVALYGDGLVAVVVYNAFDESNAGISIATTSPKWCSKQALRLIFGYPFLQLGLNRVTATVKKNNLKSRSLVERLGFILEGELKQYYDTGESAMIYGMLKDNRWVK